MHRVSFVLALALCVSVQAQEIVYPKPSPPPEVGISDRVTLEETRAKLKKRHSMVKRTAKSGGNYPAHSGAFTVAFNHLAEPSDTVLVSDQGPDNDVYAITDVGTQPGQYDLVFDLDINRYVGNVSLLLQHGLISPTFKLTIPAYDIDQSTPSEDCDNDGTVDTLNPEIDEIYVNGVFIGILSGANEVWNLQGNIFELDINLLNLPTGKNQVVTNQIGIRVDAANKDQVLSSGAVGCTTWTTEIDYVMIEFDVVDPVVFFPGMGGNPDSFLNSGYQQKLLNNYGIPSEVLNYPRETDTSCGNQLQAHADVLIEQMRLEAAAYGSDKFNVMAHSMGGLDSLAGLNRLMVDDLVTVSKLDGVDVSCPLKVHSVVTHGTPFRGSVIADWAFQTFLGDVGNNFAPICDLQVANATRASRTFPVPPGIKMISLAADADHNGDGVIDQAEKDQGLVPLGAQRQYDMLYNFIGYQTTEISILGIPVSIPEGIPDPSGQVYPNDFWVTLDSAWGVVSQSVVFYEQLFPGANHTTILHDAAQNLVIARALADLDWKVQP